MGTGEIGFWRVCCLQPLGPGGVTPQGVGPHFLN